MDEPPNAYLILFLLGILTDLIWTITIKAASKSKIHYTAFGNALLAAITLASAYWCIESKSWIDGLCYVVGCFIGTYLAYLINESIIEKDVVEEKKVSKKKPSVKKSKKQSKKAKK